MKNEALEQDSSLAAGDPRGLLSKPRGRSDWLERINNYYWVNNLLRLHQELPWDDDAKDALDELLEAHPVLVRISAAKRLRDAAERNARRTGEGRVTAVCVGQARAALTEGQAA